MSSSLRPFLIRICATEGNGNEHASVDSHGFPNKTVLVCGDFLLCLMEHREEQLVDEP